MDKIDIFISTLPFYIFTFKMKSTILVLFLLTLTVALGCNNDNDCNHGYCYKLGTPNVCICDEKYVDEQCDYKLRNQHDALAVSLATGYLGIDWFYLSRGDASYIAIGCIKLLFLLSIFICYYILRFTKVAGSDRYNWVATIAIFTPMIMLPTVFVWWLADWTRIIAGTCNFKDGNGYCLYKP